MLAVVYLVAAAGSHSSLSYHLAFATARLWKKPCAAGEPIPADRRACFIRGDEDERSAVDAETRSRLSRSRAWELGAIGEHMAKVATAATAAHVRPSQPKGK